MLPLFFSFLLFKKLIFLHKIISFTITIVVILFLFNFSLFFVVVLLYCYYLVLLLFCCLSPIIVLFIIVFFIFIIILFKNHALSLLFSQPKLPPFFSYNDVITRVYREFSAAKYQYFF